MRAPALKPESSRRNLRRGATAACQRYGTRGSPPDDVSKGMFVHITAVQKAGYTTLIPGARVSYEVRPDREGNPTAESLKIG